MVNMMLFSTVTNKSIRGHLKHNPISVNKMKKYMMELTYPVEKIADILQDRFEITLEGLNYNKAIKQEYFIPYCRFKRRDMKISDCFSPLEDKERINAENHVA